MMDERYDDVSPEEYAQMEADMEELYGDKEPSDEELDGMFVAHVRDIVERGEFQSTMSDWVQVHDQVASLGRIRDGVRNGDHDNKDLDLVLNSAEDDFKQTLDLLGYNPKSRLTPDEWVTRQGVAAGRREGRDWKAVLRGDYSVDPNKVAINDIKEIPFDEMVAYRAARKEPWTKSDTDLLNSKICDEWDELNDNHPEASRNDASDNLIRSVLRDELFKQIYITDKTRMDRLPEVTKGDYDTTKSVISEQTREHLGYEYDKYDRQQILGRLQDQVESLQDRAKFGDDFSHNGTYSYISVEPQNDRTKAFTEHKKAEVAKHREVPDDWKKMLNSIENGVSNPDYDFDEYDD